EYEFGITLRQVIEAAGGVRGGRPLRAVLLGGAAGSFVGPGALDTPLTFEAMRASGATLGSGVVLVLDDTVDVTGLLRPIAPFFRDESCGQCVPCRVGTVRQEELLARLVHGTPLGSVSQELVLLDDIAAVARDASICGLGQTAVSAVTSAVQLGLIGGNVAGWNRKEPTGARCSWRRPGGWSTSPSTGTRCASPRAPHCSTRAGSRASTRPLCATWRTSPRSTCAGCAWST